ncbi:N5-glutamine methyltransferase family protein [Amycolatopsis sp. CA-230715]|uniref:N5-glutamine methyltransferase family protein n=1 Tax=Amycolatopsis sp. CA-230715 TaxID=2745196 RepID=UPI001C02AF1D|nr:HemK/PrmC family methyltransferase [Amycolatopsis sp. CA-230715]QWF78799.1 Release factor glutamine methyltransferase [Amycolatopsis sp. CA-230715]
MPRPSLDDLIGAAERTLSDAGIEAARADAEQLAAHALGLPPHARPAPWTKLTETERARFTELVSRRADRIPLGHLLREATLGGVTVAVGPGVFVPRPHSELVLASGLEVLAGRENPVVVDLCTGSAAIALAVAHARPDATVHAVELDPNALEFARRNSAHQASLGDTPIVVHAADVTAPGLLAELTGAVDLVLANPPFVPESERLLPEYGVHHPKLAIFSGADGLHVIRHVVRLAAALLRPDGGLVVEHGHFHGRSVPELLAADAAFGAVSTHDYVDGRPLYTTANRTPQRKEHAA